MSTSHLRTADVQSLDAADVALYRDLAYLMNAHPDRYRPLGDADMTAVFTVIGVEHTTNIQLVFEALSCVGIDAVPDGEAALADFALVGPESAWREMFDDIVANGTATGPWTINSLALRGDRIALTGSDPMGLDKFSRFNQTLQEFLDGAGRLEIVRSHP